jgi:predicted exporter
VLGEQDIQVSSNPGPGHAPDPEHDGDPHQLIRAHTRELINLVGEDRFPLHSTQRQLQRYLNWWWSEDFRALVKEQTQGKTAVPQATADLVAEVEAAVSELSNAFQRGQLPTGVV